MDYNISKFNLSKDFLKAINNESKRVYFIEYFDLGDNSEYIVINEETLLLDKNDTLCVYYTTEPQDWFLLELKEVLKQKLKENGSVIKIPNKVGKVSKLELSNKDNLALNFEDITPKPLKNEIYNKISNLYDKENNLVMLPSFVNVIKC